MLTRGLHVTMMSFLIVGLALAGCAKRPATTQASAPAPTPPGPAAQAQPPSQPAATPSAAPSAPSGGPTAAAAREPIGEFRPSPDLKDIYFDFDKYNIRPGDAKILDANAGWLKSNADNLILIEGHCDERGTNEYNLALGERRAKSTMNYLVSQGVQASRITIISYGEERPVCTEKNEACWSKNRHSHFLFKKR